MSLTSRSSRPDDDEDDDDDDDEDVGGGVGRAVTMTPPPRRCRCHRDRTPLAVEVKILSARRATAALGPTIVDSSETIGSKYIMVHDAQVREVPCIP